MNLPPLPPLPTPTFPIPTRPSLPALQARRAHLLTRLRLLPDHDPSVSALEQERRRDVKDGLEWNLAEVEREIREAEMEEVEGLEVLQSELQPERMGLVGQPSDTDVEMGDVAPEVDNNQGLRSLPQSSSHSQVDVGAIDGPQNPQSRQRRSYPSPSSSPTLPSHPASLPPRPQPAMLLPNQQQPQSSRSSNHPLPSHPSPTDLPTLLCLRLTQLRALSEANFRQLAEPHLHQPDQSQNSRNFGVEIAAVEDALAGRVWPAADWRMGLISKETKDLLKEARKPVPPSTIGRWAGKAPWSMSVSPSSSSSNNAGASAGPSATIPQAGEPPLMRPANAQAALHLPRPLPLPIAIYNHLNTLRASPQALHAEVLAFERLTVDPTSKLPKQKVMALFSAAGVALLNGESNRRRVLEQERLKNERKQRERVKHQGAAKRAAELAALAGAAASGNIVRVLALSFNQNAPPKFPVDISTRITAIIRQLQDRLTALPTLSIERHAVSAQLTAAKLLATGDVDGAERMRVGWGGGWDESVEALFRDVKQWSGEPEQVKRATHERKREEKRKRKEQNKKDAETRGQDGQRVREWERAYEEIARREMPGHGNAVAGPSSSSAQAENQISPTTENGMARLTIQTTTTATSTSTSTVRPSSDEQLHTAIESQRIVIKARHATLSDQLVFLQTLQTSLLQQFSPSLDLWPAEERKDYVDRQSEILELQNEVMYLKSGIQGILGSFGKKKSKQMSEISGAMLLKMKQLVERANQIWMDAERSRIAEANRRLNSLSNGIKNTPRETPLIAGPSHTSPASAGGVVLRIPPNAPLVTPSARVATAEDSDWEDMDLSPTQYTGPRQPRAAKTKAIVMIAMETAIKNVQAQHYAANNPGQAAAQATAAAAQRAQSVAHSKAVAQAKMGKKAAKTTRKLQIATIKATSATAKVAQRKGKVRHSKAISNAIRSVHENGEVVVESAKFQSIQPAVWKAHPIGDDGAQFYRYHVFVDSDRVKDDEARKGMVDQFELFVVAMLPDDLCEDDEEDDVDGAGDGNGKGKGRQVGLGKGKWWQAEANNSKSGNPELPDRYTTIDYRVVEGGKADLSESEIRVLKESSRRLLGMHSDNRGADPYVFLASAFGQRSKVELTSVALDLTQVSTIEPSGRIAAIFVPVAAAIERHLLVHEYNERYLDNQASIPILSKALHLPAHTAEVVSHDRGEVLGDALYDVGTAEVLLEGLLSSLGSGRINYDGWIVKLNGVAKEVMDKVSNREFLRGSVRVGAHQYIRRHASSLVSLQSHETFGKKDIPNCNERVQGAVYESTVPKDGKLRWAMGNRRILRQVMSNLGMVLPALSEVDPFDLNLGWEAVFKANPRAQEATNDAMEEVQAKLGYEFKDDRYLNLAYRRVTKTSALLGVLKGVGAALCKLLVLLFAYFEGQNTVLGNVPGALDHTKSFVISNRKFRLFCERAGFRDSWSFRTLYPQNKDSQLKDFFCVLLALAHFDSGCDLSDGAAAIFEKVMLFMLENKAGITIDDDDEDTADDEEAGFEMLDSSIRMGGDEAINLVSDDEDAEQTGEVEAAEEKEEGEIDEDEEADAWAPRRLPALQPDADHDMDHHDAGADSDSSGWEDVVSATPGASRVGIYHAPETDEESTADEDSRFDRYSPSRPVATLQTAQPTLLRARGVSRKRSESTSGSDDEFEQEPSGLADGMPPAKRVRASEDEMENAGSSEGQLQTEAQLDTADGMEGEAPFEWLDGSGAQHYQSAVEVEELNEDSGMAMDVEIVGGMDETA